jgi:hypothetical protein
LEAEVQGSSGLGRFQPVVMDGGVGEPRLPSSSTAELTRLHAIANDVRKIADDIDPHEDDGDEGPKPEFLRGEFDANLAEHVDPMVLNRLASDLLQGIEADLTSRSQWEKMAEKAIEFLGLIYEEASGQVSASGNVSKVWHTLMLEASITFWANAHAEFLPADGPVKVRDDSTQAAKPRGIGDNGGPPLDVAEAGQQNQNRDETAEDFETDFNHYLTTGDRQYYRDFSRMLFSLGPMGTQFRKVYYNPLRRMAVSEWVKAENLIVSNDAVHLATAGRVTERIPMRHADVKRLQFMGWWLNQPLSQPTDTPTTMERVVGQVEGIRPGAELPADHRHTIYECYTEIDLQGFEHTDDEGNLSGLPLPYRITLDKDSRRVLEIRRNWREDDDAMQPRSRYVMFGLIPGLGFYYLGFAHILGNTERALTVLEREIIDAGMYAIFPGFVHAKGTFRADSTQIRPSPGGSLEVNVGLKKSINDVLMPVPYRDVSANVMALAQKLEDNGRKLSQAIEIPVGEGTANIPVGTMISLIEEGTKVMAAVHKGIHQSRTEEFEMLKELIAEDPSLLSRFNKSPQRVWQTAEEFQDLDLVPASDPNTPSHVHRVMRAVALGQVAQMFPDLMSLPNASGKPIREEVLEEIMRVIRVPDPARFTPAPGASAQVGTQPNPKAQDNQTRLSVAQLTSQAKLQGDAIREQGAAADRASKERIALAGEQTERIKASADAQEDYVRMHDSAAERAQDAQLAGADLQHKAEQNALDRVHDRTKMAFPTTTPPRAF